ncbi:lambda exonuclease family protein [Stutzerimonas nitrititolerans]|uniref:lambda exonuclease family protein n=1 Tax=Stutzerimonas nitrititolerans TaxID=2482751 RepID=UPI0028A8C556|nr:YqaJ viral recombinase family protein [Stutzerimonas nitrititolerans]
MSGDQLQGTEQWHADRSGRLTASRFKDVMAWTEPDAKGHRKPMAARTSYMLELCFERLANRSKHNVRSKSMDWGHEQEQASHNAYELWTGNVVTKSGFIVHPKYDWLGCSPDGLVGEDGGIESKNPYNEAVHVRTWLNGMPEEHMAQVQGCMFVTGRKWWDFLSFDSRQDEEVQLYVQHIPRDEAYIARLEIELVQFNLELNRMVDEVLDKARAQAERLAA